jgi:hypothetical protein
MIQTQILAVRVTGYEPLKRKLTVLSNKEYYRGLFRDELSKLLQHGAYYAATITHKETGHLAASHTWEYDSHRMRGRIFIDRRVAYARGSTVQWPVIYGVYEHARGGSHAFYDRTYKEFILPQGLKGLKTMVERVHTA